jgi:hypothetical protein
MALPSSNCHSELNAARQNAILLNGVADIFPNFSCNLGAKVYWHKVVVPKWPKFRVERSDQLKREYL